MFGNKQDLADRLQQSGNSISQNVNSILAVMVGASVELAQSERFLRITYKCPNVEALFSTPALTHTLNILLKESDVAKTLVTTDKTEILEGYISEVLRLDPPIQGVYREAKANETVGSTSISAGDLVYVNIASANMNVRSRIFCLDSSPYNRLGACVCGTHVDQSFSPPESLHSRRCFDQDPGCGVGVKDRRQRLQGCLRVEERDPGTWPIW